MDGFLKSLIPSASQDFVGWEDAPFLARLTSVYTPSSGAQNGQNQYAFIEQVFDPLTGFPKDATGGRRTFPQSGPFTTSYAVEANNTLLTVPSATTPPGYTSPGPYVQCKLKGLVGGAPVYDIVSPFTLSTLSATCSNYALTTSYGNLGLTINLTAGSTWLVLVQLCATMTSSSSGTGDSISCRLYDGTNTYGAAVEFCTAPCGTLTIIDAASLIALVSPVSAITLNVQGKINTSTSSGGTMYGTSNAAGGCNLVAVRVV